MSQAAPKEPLSASVAGRLTEFARACKAATRAVSLYPASHPAIAASLARLVDVAGRAVSDGPMTIAVRQDMLLIEERSPARPDAAIGEFAALLHDHLIGELRMLGAADTEAWRSFLLLLARSPSDVQAEGGIARLWTATGGQHLELRQIDYAEVLRQREAGVAAAWETILANCLAGDHVDLDDATMRMLLEIAEDPDRIAQLTAQLNERASASGVRVQTDALLRLLRGIADGLVRQAPERLDVVFANIAHAAGRLAPDVMLEVLAHRYQAPAGSVDVVDAMVTRMTDSTVGEFVARSIVQERGATDRLAQAFQALVPDVDRRQRLVGLAREELAGTPLAGEQSFPELWQRATDMLTSYRDEPFVSDGYARELSSARTHAEQVDRIADDPPERVAGWLATISDASIRSHDLALLLDLLRIEQDPGRWSDVLEPVVSHIDDLVLLGDFEAAEPLVAVITTEAGDAGRPTHRAAAAAARDRLVQGALMSYVVSHLRSIDDAGFEHVRRLCYAIGPSTIGPLAEALTVEERGRGFRRLTELLVGYGSAGREAVERLKGSANPAVRRTAIHLLREFGGNEALPELATLLDDAETHVQRDAVRAIALIGTDQAYEVLQRALNSGTAVQREAIIGALGAMRDERAVPLFCHMVRSDIYRRTMRGAYLAAVEGLGAVGGAEAVAALGQALHKGEWWAPVRSAESRRAVAIALRRIGSREALAWLREAVERGSRGVRAAAREQLALAERPGREAHQP